MSVFTDDVRRVVAGKPLGVVLGVLVAGSVLVQGGFLPAYLAILFASAVRNVAVAALGDGLLFWAVAAVGLYVQAVVVTATVLAGRRVVRAVRRTRAGPASP